MKKFMNLKVKTWELVVICLILVCVVMRPDWLIQLNQELIGKVLLLVALVVAAYYKPYMGLLVLLLIVSLGFYREGLSALEQAAISQCPHFMSATDCVSGKGGTTGLCSWNTAANVCIGKSAMSSMSSGAATIPCPSGCIVTSGNKPK